MTRNGAQIRHHMRSRVACAMALVALVATGLSSAPAPASASASATPTTTATTTTPRTTTLPTWTLLDTFPTADAVTALSCPTTSECIAVGGTTSNAALALLTTNAGTTWDPLTLPTGLKPLQAISCAAATDCVAVGETTKGAIAAIDTVDTGSAWTAGTLPGLAGTLDSISCPVSTSCVAGFTPTVSSLQPSALVTINGGATWHVPPGLTGTSPVLDSSCPTASVCYAVAGFEGAGFGGTTGGSSFASGWAPIPTTELNGGPLLGPLSCASESACVLAYLISGSGYTLATTTDSGAKWTVVLNKLVTTSIACPSTAECIAGGTPETNIGGKAPLLVTTSTGKSWAEPTLPSTLSAVTGVSCASTSTCTAIGQNTSGASVVVGMSGTSVPVVGGVSPLAGHLGAGTVVSVAGSGFASGDTVNFGTHAASAVSVESDGDLLATAPAGTAGAVGVTVTGGGKTSSKSPADDFTYLATVPTVSSVVPADGPNYGGATVEVTGTNFDLATGVLFGKVASSSFTVESANTITVDAPAGTGAADVTVENAAGTSATTTHGVYTYVTAASRTWSTASTYSDEEALNDVSCPSAAVCFATGSGIFGTTDGGTSWSLISPDVTSLVSCSSTSDCVATTQTGVLVTTNGGAEWTAVALPAGGGTPYALSCADGGTTCAVVTEVETTQAISIAISLNEGATWVSHSLPKGDGIGNIECPPSGACIAVGSVAGPHDTSVGAAFVTSNGGSSWSVVDFPTGVTSMSSISCFSSTTCMAIGQSGGDFLLAIATTTTSGNAWTLESAPTIEDGGGFNPESVSCPTAQTCVLAVDESTEDGSINTDLVTTDFGSSFASATVPAGIADGNVTAVSCPTAENCEAVSNSPVAGGARSGRARGC
jgi:hypothetical protein